MYYNVFYFSLWKVFFGSQPLWTDWTIVISDKSDIWAYYSRLNYSTQRKNGWEREENRNIILLLYNNNGPLVNTLCCCVHKWHYIMHAKWLNLYEAGIMDSRSWYITQKSNKGRDRHTKKFLHTYTHTLINKGEEAREKLRIKRIIFATQQH